MDGASTLLEQFLAEGTNFIERAMTEQWPETLLLDFKTAANNSGPMAPEDKKNLAKALSGFANSEGGVIVWGVLADRQLPDEPDVATERRPIRKLKVFLSDLLSYTPQLVSPPIINVVHEPAYLPGVTETGYIVTYIPKCDSPPPRMNMASGEGRYYCRSGASFIRMEPYMVADFFSRRQQPKLEFFYRLAPNGMSHQVSLLVGIRNVGTGIALYPGLEVAVEGNFSLDQYGLSGNSLHDQGLPKRILAHDRVDGNCHLFAGGPDYPLYPDTGIEVTRFASRLTDVEASRPDQFPPITIRYRLFCEGFTLAGETEVPFAELAAHIT